MSKKGVDISGSRAYNRLDFQISQAMLLVVEWYDCEDFTIVMDFYDDVAVFEGENGPVSFFQIKTDEEPITIGTILGQNWLHELCRYLVQYADRVKEIALITSSPIKLKRGSLQKSDKSSALKLLQGEELSEFLKNVETAYGVSRLQIESALFYRCSLLGVRNHEKYAQGEFVNFLQSQYESIGVKLANTIASTIRGILQTAQKTESIDENASEEEVKKCKGVTRTHIEKIIQDCVFVEPLNWRDIERFAPKELHEGLYRPYVLLLSDRSENGRFFSYAYGVLREIVGKNVNAEGVNVWEYCKMCVTKACKDNQYFSSFVRSSVSYYAELLALNIYLSFMKL